MNYAVVIVTCNRLELLKECVASVEAQTYPVSKVVIVNNASSDGTAQYLDSLDEKYIVLHQQTNLGGAGGFQLGIGCAAELPDIDYVLIIDDDAMISPDYIRFCDEYLSAHAGCPAVSGTVMTDGQIQLNHRRVISNALIFSEKNVPLSAYQRDTFVYRLSTFCGLMIRQSEIRKIGLPKAEYFISYDDTEYSMRLPQIVNINAATLNHKTKLTQDNSTFYGRMNWRTYYIHRNRYDLIKSHCSKLSSYLVPLESAVFMLGAVLAGRKDMVPILKAACEDGYRGNLGKNPKYLPGK